MPDILIERNHTLGLAAAREVARQWMQKAEQDYGLACSYVEGQTSDRAVFTRAGIDGSVDVGADTFALRATLGMLFGGFSAEIEQRLGRSLDALLDASAQRLD